MEGGGQFRVRVARERSFRVPPISLCHSTTIAAQTDGHIGCMVFKLHLTLAVFCPVPLFAKHSKYGEIIVLLEITVREHSLSLPSVSSLLFSHHQPNRLAGRQERSL